MTDGYVPHHDPEGEYEEMLDRLDLACHAYACWRAATWRIDCKYGPHLPCDEHRDLRPHPGIETPHSEQYQLER